jgi:isocitrate/isopropylmalate dehydrogenase
MILDYLGKKEAADAFLSAIKKVVKNNLEHP